jgi:chloramphenicol-sensitive protein RarD
MASHLYPQGVERSRGVLFGVLAYLLWGAFPLYWPLLEPAGAFEILAHRLIWSLVVMSGLVIALRRAPQFMALVRDRRTLGLLALAAVTVTCNWATYIWGVNHGRVVETSLGYFVNPLVTMLLGVLVLRERLRRLQWVAVGIAAVAVAVLTIDYGRLPWLALILALSFGTYGLAKKQAAAGAFESLALETAVMAPLALVYVVLLAARGESHFASDGAGHAWLFVSSGVVTAVPLILFGAAAVRVPLVTLGLLQYLAPILQFALGVLHFHEEMSAGRWIGFGIVWIALVVFTADSIRARRTPVPTQAAPIPAEG